MSEEVWFGTPGAFGDQLWADPAALLARLRGMGAVVPAPFPVRGRTTWLITRMTEVVEVLRDSGCFSVDFADVAEHEARRSSQHFTGDGTGPSTEDGPDEGFTLISRTMLGVDGLDHRRLRGLVSRVFTPRYVQGLRPSIQCIADRLIDEVAAAGTMDLVEDFAYPLPINVICSILGIPDDHWDVLRAGSMALVQGETEGGGAERADRLDAFGELIAREVAQRRRDPQDDLISQLIRAEEAGDRLGEPELLSMIGLLVVAGHETTSSLIGSGTLALLDCPDQLARLRADPGLVPAAVEELLRLTGPNLFTPVPRLVTCDVEVGGRQLRQGDVVIPLLAAANHDETQFADPATLDVARRIQRHVAFGHGIHTCLGAPLARLEGDIAFTTLLRRLPGLRIGVPREAITVHGMRDVRGLTSLPVVF